MISYRLAGERNFDYDESNETNWVECLQETAGPNLDRSSGDVVCPVSRLDRFGCLAPYLASKRALLLLPKLGFNDVA